MRLRAFSTFVVLPLSLFSIQAAAKGDHAFKGNVEFQLRSNSNISLAPFSGSGFDFADADEFGDGDEDVAESDGDDDFDDGFDDDVALGFDEDEIDEDDAVDEDGDGIDDLVDADGGSKIDKQQRGTVKLALNHRYKLGKSGAWVSGAKLGSDHHQDRDDLDKLNYAATTGFEYSPEGSRHKIKPAISYVVLDKDGERFAETFVSSLSYQYEATKRLALSATYNHQDKDVTKPGAPDARIDTLSLGADVKVTGKDIVKLRYAPKIEDSTVTTRNTDAYGFDIAYSRKLPWDMVAGLGYSFDSVQYDRLEPMREDDSDTYAIEVSKSFGKRYVVGAGYEAKERRSNIPGKDSENESTYVEVSWRF